MPDLFQQQRRLVKQTQSLRVTGRVVEVTGLTVVAEGLAIPVGSLCRIDRAHDRICSPKTYGGDSLKRR